jgi:rhamnose utilization protein RhaD (predicted bifunctional aldolase and dehydrogenase)
MQQDVLAFFSPTSTTYHTTINKVVEAKMVEEKEGGEVMESNNNNRNKLAETKIKSEQKIAFNMGGKHIHYLPSEH